MGSHPSRSTLVTSNHQELKMSSESVSVFSVVLILVSSVSPSPRNKDLHQRNGDFDLTELMNKFLAEYDSGNGNEYEPHKEEISFDPEPQYNQDHQPYHHQQQQHHQYYQDKPQQPSYQGYPSNEPQRSQVYNRYKDESKKVNGVNQDEQKSVAQTSNSAKASQQPSVSAKEQTETSQEEVDPKLRDFTLIISKLLFQLSQL